MKFMFYSAAYVSSTSGMISDTSVLELENIDEAIKKLESGSIIFDKKAERGFVPVTFEKVQDVE
ncbi:hypothetical protein I6I19_03680 [Lactococcus garvieae]|nr:hypothetical protein I6I19_03680 [Lactococcus garvieae]USI71058.1 hypothetical protein LMJ99_03860 [Lactococcus garvieae subsp. garvieae]